MSAISGAISTDAARAQRLDKGLKDGALGLLSSTVVGVASTAPAYSLAATLGFVVVLIGVRSPIVTVLAFVPMLLISFGYKELNNADPDCGTTFTWATRAFGPRAGWMGGWGIVAADILVMPSLAQVAGQYVFLLFGAKGIGSQAEQRLGTARRGPVDRSHDGHLLCGYRDICKLPEGAARRRGDHACGAFRRGSCKSGGRICPGRAPDPGVVVVGPLRRLVLAFRRRPHPDAVYLLGLGHLGVGQRGDSQQARLPWARSGDIHGRAVGGLRARDRGDAVLRRPWDKGDRARATPAT